MNVRCPDCLCLEPHYAHGRCERCWRAAYQRLWMRRYRARRKRELARASRTPAAKERGLLRRKKSRGGS